jgi:hypothetical protein
VIFELSEAGLTQATKHDRQMIEAIRIAQAVRVDGSPKITTVRLRSLGVRVIPSCYET